jgi:hypothetical protein
MSRKPNLFPLIQNAGTLEQARRFLKSHNLPSSAGSWKEMIETRFERYLEDGKLTGADIASFLSTIEEHGRQHVFLYKARHVGHLFPTAKLQHLLSQLPGFPRLNEPRIAELPKSVDFH